MSSTAVLSTLDLNTPHSLFLSGGPRLSSSPSSSSQRRDRDRRSFRSNDSQVGPTPPSGWTGGPVYSSSPRFNPFEDETVAPPYTHYYYYDTTTNSPALAFDHKPQQPTCNTTTNTITPANLNRRSPSPPSPSSLTSFYPPTTMSSSLVENHGRRSPSPPSHVRRRSGAMSLGSNDYVNQGHHGYPLSNYPYVSQPSKGFTVVPIPSTPRLAPRPSPYSYQTPQTHNNNNKKSFGSRGPNRNGNGYAHQATLVSSGRTNPPIERPASAPPLVPVASATLNTANNSTQSPMTRPVATRSQSPPSTPSPSTQPRVQQQTQTQSSIYTLLSRPLPASSRDTIAGIVASMLLSRADSGSGAARPRKCNSGSYVKSGLSRVVFVE